MYITSFPREIPDEKVLVFNSETKFFCPGQEIKALRGGVHRYAAQVTPQIDTASAEKDRFRMETN